ncbi:hypothetical protein N7453_003489 [Penicillium expansum]|nr:hypothetical protein N7453_003489 [Penicillium expansum]
MVRREPATTGVDLKLVYPRDKGTKTDLDIIAIHGLGTKSPDTWQFNNAGKGNKSTVNWLEDEDMLLSLVGDASIWTCDWPSKMFQDSDSAKKRIDEIARQIVSGIARRLPPSDNNDQERPILFIASCLGGIILMKALADSMETDPIRSATRGIIFLATPFNGTAFAQIEHWALPALSAKGRIQEKKTH